MEWSSSMSADLYSDLTIGLGMKNYPCLSASFMSGEAGQGRVGLVMAKKFSGGWVVPK